MMLIIKEQEEPDTVSEEQIFIAVTQMNKQHTTPTLILTPSLMLLADAVNHESWNKERERERVKVTQMTCARLASPRYHVRPNVLTQKGLVSNSKIGPFHLNSEALHCGTINTLGSRGSKTGKNLRKQAHAQSPTSLISTNFLISSPLRN